MLQQIVWCKALLYLALIFRGETAHAAGCLVMVSVAVVHLPVLSIHMIVGLAHYT